LVPGSSIGGKFKLSVDSAARRVRATCDADDGGGRDRGSGEGARRSPGSRGRVPAAAPGLVRAR
jgi:hypothetical protein